MISNPAGFPISIFFFLAEWKAWGKQFYWHMSSPLFPCSWKTALPVGRLRSIVWTTRLTRQPQRDAPGARESSTPSLPAGKKGPFMLTSAGTQGWAPLGRRSCNVSILDRWLNSLHQLGSPHLSPHCVCDPSPWWIFLALPRALPWPGGHAKVFPTFLSHLSNFLEEFRHLIAPAFKVSRLWIPQAPSHVWLPLAAFITDFETVFP